MHQGIYPRPFTVTTIHAYSLKPLYRLLTWDYYLDGTTHTVAVRILCGVNDVHILADGLIVSEGGRVYRYIDQARVVSRADSR